MKKWIINEYPRRLETKEHALVYIHFTSQQVVKESKETIDYRWKLNVF